MLVLIVARMQAILKSEHARRRLNQISGALLIAVGLIIPLTKQEKLPQALTILTKEYSYVRKIRIQ